MIELARKKSVLQLAKHFGISETAVDLPDWACRLGRTQKLAPKPSAARLSLD